MADEKLLDKEGNEDSADETIETPESSYQKLKVVNEDLAKRLQAQENAAAAERRKQEDRIKALEAKNAEPKEDSERIAALEVKLAKSTAVSRYGLSEEDADLLKGSPDEILSDAEYWAERLKANKPAEEEDKTNRQVIDEKLDDKVKPPHKPDPKKGNLSWLETYQTATPAERYKMDEDVLAGRVNPHAK